MRTSSVTPDPSDPEKPVEPIKPSKGKSDLSTKLMEGLPWLAALIASVLILSWLAAMWILYSHVDTANDDKWGRLLSIFGFLHTVASAAIGAILGIKIQNDKVVDAKEQAQKAEERAEDETKKAREVQDRSVQGIAEAQQQVAQAIQFAGTRTQISDLGIKLAAMVVADADKAAVLTGPAFTGTRSVDSRAVELARELLAIRPN